MSDVPDPPVGTADAGARLWRSVVDDYDLQEHELVLLREAVRLVDRLDELATAVAEDGVMVPAPPAGERVHPALVEARQQQLALSRVLAALRLPSGDEDAARPQRRVGPRGVYGVGGGPARLRSVS